MMGYGSGARSETRQHTHPLLCSSVVRVCQSAAYPDGTASSFLHEKSGGKGYSIPPDLSLLYIDRPPQRRVFRAGRRPVNSFYTSLTRRIGRNAARKRNSRESAVNIRYFILRRSNQASSTALAEDTLSSARSPIALPHRRAGWFVYHYENAPLLPRVTGR